MIAVIVQRGIGNEVYPPSVDFGNTIGCRGDNTSEASRDRSCTFQRRENHHRVFQIDAEAVSFGLPHQLFNTQNSSEKEKDG